MRIYFVDSFTNQSFKGNPAAVVLQDKALPDKLMQNIAQEIGFSETAFLLKDDKDKYLLRWFSPTTEVSLCGHATLASAKVFFTYLSSNINSVKFITKYGILVCSQEEDKIKITFPKDSLSLIDKYEEIKKFFAFEIKRSILFSKVNHYLCIFVANEINISTLNIDSKIVTGLSGILPEIRGLVLSNQETGIVKIRFFDPWEGILEDPVTGSAGLVVSEYWFKELDKNYIKIEQMSARGGKMEIRNEEENVSILGHAIIILEGKLMVGNYGN